MSFASFLKAGCYIATSSVQDTESGNVRNSGKKKKISVMNIYNVKYWKDLIKSLFTIEYLLNFILVVIKHLQIELV